MAASKDELKQQFMALAHKGHSNAEIAQITGLPSGSVAAYRAHLTRGSYNTETDALDGVDGDLQEIRQMNETKLGLERDLQRALLANIAQLEPGLRIIDGGKEQGCASGRIDILAENERGETRVIELKAGTADHEAVSQVLSYMGEIVNGEPQRVRGIVIANDFTPRAISAARMTPNVALVKYACSFKFSTVSHTGGSPADG